MPRSRRNRGSESSKKQEWYRIDLHLHTPGSHDFQEPHATYLDILRKAEAEGLDIIAFTDHNTVAGYAAMRQEISDLERWEASGRLRPEERDRLQEYRRLLDEILVLPGFELTATFGFHILAIFDPETPIRVLEHTLLKLNVPLESLDAGETEVGATSDVLTAYRVMDEAGALVIAAHANSSNGVAMFGFDFGGQTKIAYTQDSHLHALEVTDLESGKRRSTASFFNGSRPQYPRRMHCIQGSDAHRIHGIAGSRQHLGVGERATEVLLPEPTFAALKELFASNDYSRVRPYRRTEEPFDHVEAARKEGPSIVQSFHEQMTRQGGRLHAIMRDIVAFANTNGGTIYVGVSANQKTPPKGIDKPEEAINELRTEIGRLITPPIDVGFGVLASKGKHIVTITVPKGSEPPYVLEGSRIYLRHESETSLAVRDEIVSIVERAVVEQADSAPLSPAPRPSRPQGSGRGNGGQRAARESEPPARQPSQLPKQQPRPSQGAPSAEQPKEDGGERKADAKEDNQEVERPHTGVEIVDSVERKGVIYHTMRDLRNGGEVHNVSRQSARRLWRYAIALKEKDTFREDKVSWVGNLGMWHKYLRAGKPHYDLVQRDESGRVHIYYGVTEDGIHGPWRRVVGLEQ